LEFQTVRYLPGLPVYMRNVHVHLVKHTVQYTRRNEEKQPQLRLFIIIIVLSVGGTIRLYTHYLHRLISQIMRRGVIGTVGKANRGLMQLSQRSHHCGHPHTHQHTPKSVRIVEVGPRDGLQNEKQPITFQQKLQLIGLLKQTGLKNIEAGSFVSPKWVPQMADAENIFSELAKETDGKVMYSALTPNTKGII
jgi:hypothetical protein